MKKRLIVGALGIILFLTMLFLGGGWYSNFLSLLAVLAYCEWVNINRKSRKNQFTIADISYFLIGLLYVGYGFFCLMDLRLQPNGLYRSLLLLSIVWASDTGAYFIGKYWGHSPLCPRISPKKTWEGAFAAILFGMLVTIVFSTFIQLRYNPIIIGLIISVSAIIGDLIESMIKRKYNVKDSGYLLPGHGGILDRFDSLIFVSIVVSLFRLS